MDTVAFHLAAAQVYATLAVAEANRNDYGKSLDNLRCYIDAAEYCIDEANKAQFPPRPDHWRVVEIVASDD